MRYDRAAAWRMKGAAERLPKPWANALPLPLRYRSQNTERRLGACRCHRDRPRLRQGLEEGVGGRAGRRGAVLAAQAPHPWPGSLASAAFQALAPHHPLSYQLPLAAAPETPTPTALVFSLPCDTQYDTTRHSHPSTTARVISHTERPPPAPSPPAGSPRLSRTAAQKKPALQSAGAFLPPFARCCCFGPADKRPQCQGLLACRDRTRNRGCEN